MIDWLLQNKEWVFSGIGVLILGGLGKLLFDRLHRRGLLSASGGMAIDPAPKSAGAASGPAVGMQGSASVSGGVVIDPAQQVDRSRAGPAVVIRGSANVAPTTVLEKNTTGALGDWLNATVRIRIGDYYSVQAGNFLVRVEVTDIRMASIRAEIGGGVTDELAVELHVSLGGAVVRGGPETVQVSTNQYLVPRFQYDQSLRSLYFVSTTNHRSIFFFVSVTHINTHDGCADISLVKAAVSG
jgi:hypothetical protein